MKRLRALSACRPSRIVILICLLACLCVGQTEKPWQFPSASLPQIDARLQDFMRAQAEGRWNEGESLLGKYRRAPSRYMLFTASHKACLIDVMKASPMVSFNYRIQEGPFSSELLTTPPNRRWWTLTGDAGFRTASGVKNRQISLVAYRDGESWFFTPPPIDNLLLNTEVTAQELAADRASKVEVRIPPDAPIRLVDLHVHIDAKDFAFRNVEFKFYNQTDKKIKGYSFVLADERDDGSISVGAGEERDAIMPLSESRVWNENYAAFLFLCEGEPKIHIEVNYVMFADGTTWEMKTKGSN